MKIAVVTPVFPPYAGGIGNVAAQNALQLQRLGHQVKVFTPLYQPVNIQAEVPAERVAPVVQWGNAAWLPQLSWMLRGFDVIHLHYPFFGGAEPIWLHHRGFKKRKTRIVLHYHMDVVGQGSKKLFFQVHEKLFLPRFIKMADHVIVTSKDYAQESALSRWLARQPKKFTEIPNGVDTKRFQPASRDLTLAERLGITPAEKVILFVGGLDTAHYFKGVEHLIEAASRLRLAEYAWKLVIVGQGDLLPQYESLASQLGIDAKTIFASDVSDAELPTYYHLADLVVLPSIDSSEAFGMVLLEAMSCAKPVVASDLPGVRTVVEQGINGLTVPVKNPDALASAINRICSDIELAKSFGQAGLLRARQRYDWEIIGQQLDQLFQRL